MTVIIGLLGAAGAGKSTVAAHLAERYGAHRYSLAGPLKEIARRTMGFTEAQVYGSQSEKEAVDARYGFSPRWFLQRLGTEGMRHVFGEDVWVDLLLETVGRERPEVAVVDDVRFVNEAHKIRLWCGSHLNTAYGQLGMVWRLENPDRVSVADASHASEAQWRDAPHDLVLAPTRYGTEHLLRLVDDACSRYNIPTI